MLARILFSSVQIYLESFLLSGSSYKDKSYEINISRNFDFPLLKAPAIAISFLLRFSKNICLLNSSLKTKSLDIK